MNMGSCCALRACLDTLRLMFGPYSGPAEVFLCNGHLADVAGGPGVALPSHTKPGYTGVFLFLVGSWVG